MATDNLEVAALGRPFTLGCLYDARKDALVPGFVLWDQDTLKSKKVENLQHSSTFEVSASDSIESKSSLMDIKASLKASFLGGLIEVGGSAKYLKDSKKFKEQSRVTCQYKATTISSKLAMTQLETMNPQQKEIIEKSMATHVVTGILYGAEAFFVFDSQKLDDKNTEEIKGHMEAVIKKIPTIDVKGDIDAQLTAEEKNLVETFSCKFYGDFILESNPASFKDAVQTYVGLPNLLKKTGENSVPLKVWLMPLKVFEPEAAELKRELSYGLVKKVQETLEDLREIGMRCNDSLLDAVAENFPQIKKELSRFKDLKDYYESKLRQTLAEKLPSIREGKEVESSLEQVFEDRRKSPFSQEMLTKWLDDKEREINVIKSCVGRMEGTKIIQSQSKLDREVLAAGVEEALCFIFTSLESHDPCLDEMAKHLDSLGASAEDDVWYKSDEVVIKMREKAETFGYITKCLQDNSRFCFLIAAISNATYKGASIYQYKKGILHTDHYPETPDVKTVSHRGDLMWHACDLTLDNDAANTKFILSEGNKTATFEAEQSSPDAPQASGVYDLFLCADGLAGRCYWEMEWSGHVKYSASVGVCYRGMSRKDRLGKNSQSWCLELCHSPGSAAQLSALHDKQHDDLPVPPAFSRLGVYLDWSAGTLSYYRISSDTLSHIYTFNTKFTEPVYPAVGVSWGPNMGLTMSTRHHVIQLEISSLH